MAECIGSSLAGIFRGVCGLRQASYVTSEVTLSAKPKILEIFGGQSELQIVPSRILAP